MNHKLLLFSAALLLLLAGRASSQISNLKVGGSGTNFTVNSGDTVSWSYNVSPVGATTVIQVWLDVNGNGAIDSSTDVLFQQLMQTDGDTQGNGGPPDMDGLANGSVQMHMPVGLAPGKYVLKFTEGGTSEIATGLVNPLASPAHTISGTVTVPGGFSAANIFVEASRDGQYQPNFWDALTDASGNYTIRMNADTAGNPWHVSVISKPFPTAISWPAEQDIVVSGNPSGINFSISQASAEVVGYLRTEGGSPIPSQRISLSRLDTINAMSTVEYYSNTDVNGFFLIPIPDSALIAGRTWRLFSSVSQSDTTTTQLAAVNEMQVNKGDSLVRNLVIYNADSQISGIITLNGAAPGFQMMLVADNNDSAQAATWTDNSGNFTLQVSTKVSNYIVFPVFLPQGYSYQQVTAHPGTTGLRFDLTTTAVREAGNLPSGYELGQNFPNPFNPSTVISYRLPAVSRVTLKVYDVLGRNVATLVDEVQNPGQHAVKFDGSALPSGVYFYRLEAGSFTSVRKLVLMK